MSKNDPVHSAVEKRAIDARINNLVRRLRVKCKVFDCNEEVRILHGLLVANIKRLLRQTEVHAYGTGFNEGYEACMKLRVRDALERTK